VGEQGSPGSPCPDDGRSLYEYALVAWKRRRAVGACALAFGVLTFAYGLMKKVGLLPRSYESTAMISPPSQTGGTGLLGRLASASPELGALAGMFAEGEPAKFYTDVLESREIRERVAEANDLATAYDVESACSAARKLAERSAHKVTRGGLIKISVTDGSPELAAGLANSFHEELNGLLHGLRNTQASRERDFLEQRLADVEKTLKQAGAALREFQERYGTLSIGDSARSLMDVYAGLKSELSMREIGLEVLAEFKTESDPEVLAAKKAVESIRQQLASLDEPRTLVKANPSGEERFAPGEALVPIREMPRRAMRYAELLRDVEVQESVYEFLTMQLEAALIQEAKDTPVCRAVQLAKPPEKPSDLGALFLTVLGLLAGSALGGVVAVVLEDRSSPPDGRHEPHGAAAGGE
jgi:uncharacterized protein involved in exopolysaccharide biosynthesis